MCCHAAQYLYGSTLPSGESRLTLLQQQSFFGIPSDEIVQARQDQVDLVEAASADRVHMYWWDRDDEECDTEQDREAQEMGLEKVKWEEKQMKCELRQLQKDNEARVQLALLQQDGDRADDEDASSAAAAETAATNDGDGAVAMDLDE